MNMVLHIFDYFVRCLYYYFFICLQLILNEKGFLNQRRTVVLHQGEGPIKNIKWKGSLIAWSNELVCNQHVIHIAQTIFIYCKLSIAFSSHYSYHQQFCFVV